MARGNGEGSIFYDKTRERWRGVVTVAKGQRRTVYGKTKKEAVQKMNELKSSLIDGSYCELSDLTVEEYLGRLIETERKKNLIKETTYRRKIEILKKIQTHNLAKMRIQAVTPAQIDDFLLSLTDYSNSLIRKEYALLKRCFEDNIPEIIKVSPMKKIKCPKSNQKEVKQRALTMDEQRKLLNVLRAENNIKYKEQLLIMLNTGMRMGEINALTAADVNLNFGTVEVSRTITKNADDVAILGEDTKTNAGNRLLPLSATAQAIFTEVIKNYTPNPLKLLFTANGAPISTNQVNMELSRVLKKYKIIDATVPGKVSLHSLRHTYATRCIESGMSAKVLQELLGHTDIRVTMNTYCDAFEQFKTVDISRVEEYLKENFA